MRLFSAREAAAGYGAPGVLSPLHNTSEGLRTVPTYTTPTLTLTPSTLRSIEESLMDHSDGPERPAAHHYQAGFVAPAVTFSQLDQHRWQGGVTTVTAGRAAAAAGPSSLLGGPAAARPVQGHRRGGRRPRDDAVSPEEERRRRLRRERNKQAAARCRERRVTLTNTLQAETDELEAVRAELEHEIRQLQAQKEELHFLMESHRPCCRLGKENAPGLVPLPSTAARRGAPQPPVKQEPFDQEATVPQVPALVPYSLAQAQSVAQTVPQNSQSRQARPTSLSLTSATRGSGALSHAVPISTPSHGLGLNFDSLMEGGTGLTPVTSASLMSMLPAVSGATPLATPVVSSQSEMRRGDMLSPGDRHLVSL